MSLRFSDSILNYFSIKKYNDDYYKLTFINNYQKNITIIKQEEEEEEEEEEEKEDLCKLSNNLSRAKGKVFEYAMCNDFEYFITLTLNGKKHDRDNLDLFIKNFGQWLRNYKRKYNLDIKYILIPERHLDGAWHMHGLIKGIPHSHFTINKNGYLDWLEYQKKFGWVSLSKVKDQVAVSKYITKYISKSVNQGEGVTEKSKKLYYNSRGLNVSNKIIEGQILNDAYNKIDFDFVNKYVSLKDLTKNQFLEFCQAMDVE